MENLLWSDIEMDETSVGNNTEKDVDTIFETNLNETQKMTPQLEHSLLNETDLNAIDIDTDTITLTDITLKEAEYLLALQDTTANNNAINPPKFQQAQETIHTDTSPTVESATSTPEDRGDTPSNTTLETTAAFETPDNIDTTEEQELRNIQPTITFHRNIPQPTPRPNQETMVSTNTLTIAKNTHADATSNMNALKMLNSNQDTLNNSHLKVDNIISLHCDQTITNITPQIAEQRARTEARILLQLRHLDSRAHADIRHNNRIETLTRELNRLPAPRILEGSTTLLSLVDDETWNSLNNPYPSGQPEFIGSHKSWADRAHQFDSRTLPPETLAFMRNL